MSSGIWSKIIVSEVMVVEDCEKDLGLLLENFSLECAFSAQRGRTLTQSLLRDTNTIYHNSNIIPTSYKKA